MGALLLTSNNSATTVAANAVIPIGSAVHGYGQSIKVNGNVINLSGSGYYDINSSFTVAPTADAAISITMYNNGVAVSGATASVTPGAAGASVNLSIPWVIRKSCCCDPTSITFVIDSAGTINESIVRVEKL